MLDRHCEASSLDSPARDRRSVVGMSPANGYRRRKKSFVAEQEELVEGRGDFAISYWKQLQGTLVERIKPWHQFAEVGKILADLFEIVLITRNELLERPGWRRAHDGGFSPSPSSCRRSRMDFLA